MLELYNSCSDDPIEIDLTCKEFPGVDLMWESIWAEIRRKEEDVIKQVLRELLKREPEKEDFKNCALGYYHGESRYQFSYKDVVLGCIEIKLYPEGTITFTPHAGTV